MKKRGGFLPVEIQVVKNLSCRVSRPIFPVSGLEWGRNNGRRMPFSQWSARPHKL